MLSPEIIPALIRFALFIGCVLLLGAGFFSRFIWVQNLPVNSGAQLRTASVLGMFTILAFSTADIAFTANRAFGGLDLATFWSYLTNSRHGTATITRVILSVAMAALGVGVVKNTKSISSSNAFKSEPGAGITDRIMFGALSISVLVTLSLTSHAGVNGWASITFFSDLIHLIAMNTWVGAVAFFAFSPATGWKYLEPSIHALSNVSRVGLTAVIAMVATGTFVGITKIVGWQALTGSSYGQSLIVKLVIIVLILSVAWNNRFRRLPALQRQRTAPNLERFRRIMQVETFLLAGVLMASGYLVTQPPPERGVTLRNKTPFSQSAGGWTATGIFKPIDGGTSLEVRFKDISGNNLTPHGYTFKGQLNMLDHAMQPVLLRNTTTVLGGPGAYRADALFWMSGHWEAVLTLPLGGIIRVPLRAQ